MKSIRIILVLAVLLSFASCEKKQRPYEGKFKSVFLYYGIGYNDLSGDLKKNVESMLEGEIPGINEDKALLIYSHNTKRGGDYTTPTSPSLTRVYKTRKRGEDIIVRDTLEVFSSDVVSASADMLNFVLSLTRRRFYSDSYGLMVSSHSTGWIPPGYNRNSDRSALSEQSSIGVQYFGTTSKKAEIDVQDFARAIPMKLDYIILDACLASCSEIAYEFRDVCDILVASPTEVLTTGFVYKPLCKRLLGGNKPDIKGVCTDYFDFYNEKSGSFRSATIAMIDCRETAKVAAACKTIFDNHRTALENVNRYNVQKYFDANLPWFYDLRDLAVKIGASAGELADLDAALKACVLYHAETPYFLSVRLENCCGLSIYIPYSGWSKLNTYYKTLSWNEAAGLVK